MTSITVCPTRLGDPDQTGRRRPEKVVSSAYDLEMDIVVEAIGQKLPQDIHEILPGVEFRRWSHSNKTRTDFQPPGRAFSPAATL